MFCLKNLLPVLVDGVKVPRHDSKERWCSFFEAIMQKNELAPFLIMMGYCQLLADGDTPTLVVPSAREYAWIGEAMADAERDVIETAAEETGLFGQGINQMVEFILSNKKTTDMYCSLLTWIADSRHIGKELSKPLRMRCRCVKAMKKFFVKKHTR